jgi:methylmalonyl-CoA mutase
LSKAPVPRYQLQFPVRVVTAAALFDGHDASINMIRRLLQEAGAEVIHLGHNRSVADVVRTVLQEGAQGVCVSSYQGGHMEYFKYMRDLLDQAGATYVKIYGGGGGVIIHEEKKELESYGIAQIFHPDDGRRMGLEGMIDTIVQGCDFDLAKAWAGVDVKKAKGFEVENPIPSLALGLALTEVENGKDVSSDFVQLGLEPFRRQGPVPLVVGITGTGGAGKSSLIDELIQRFLNAYPNKKVAAVCVDPSKRKSGGSLLGDRIRMNSLSRKNTFMRSLASRGSGREIADSLAPVLDVVKKLDFDLVIAETSGIGQGNMAITEVSDISMYVMTSDFGAQSQLEKIDMIDFADLIAVNKADRRGAHDAVRDVSKQYRRSRKILDSSVPVPVFLTQASHFNDGGVNQLFFKLTDILDTKEKGHWLLGDDYRKSVTSAEEHVIIPVDRQNYLAEIVTTVRKYKQRTETLAQKASQLGAIQQIRSILKSGGQELDRLYKDLSSDFTSEELQGIETFETLQKKYSKDEFVFNVRGKEIRQPLTKKSLSGSRIPRVVVPQVHDWGDRFRYLKLENVPGEFPFTAGVYPLKREDEDPKRMFAGEGPPEKTNKRFHYLCEGERAQRLSTAFDSVTLYGQDPNLRPDIFGKVGESGVSVCTLDDMKKLYAGFDLCSPTASVSMTINGPAPMILAFYFNTAIDQQVEIKQKELGRALTMAEHAQISEWTLQQVRGTVQADILKEDQGQNTCIFSIQFALKMMGDIQQYFVNHHIRNFYSVSISGYHIAEAGANPISQLAFTLSNGFTFVEYYLARGMSVDDFAGNLSFFFSNGLDPEYAALGRVARRIWAIAIRDLYKGDERSQKLKYHIQTSGRSLHAQEISFNDIRTTLQALLAIYDNCNSLHTNAYDEAITTPTEESVRRAMAIQLIINKEFGMTINENPMQGSYFMDQLTDLLEEAVLEVFLRLNERGGVLGSMETQYQRSKIQEESMYYEHLKHSGELPVIGVNSYIDPKTLAHGYVPPKIEMARASLEEKNYQLRNCDLFKAGHSSKSELALVALKQAALQGHNIFEALMEASRVCTLGQMSQALYEVGGQYRRNL